MDSSLLFSRIAFIILIIVFIITVAVFISTIIGCFAIDVTKYSVSSEKIPNAFDGYKILQLSDLHNVSLGKNNTRLLKKIEKIKPDIIVMTGDMINTNSKNYNNFFSFTKEIANKYTCYYIMGNHEMRLSGQKQLDILYKLTALGVNVLNNNETTILKDNELIHNYGLHQPITTYKNALKNKIETDFTLDNMNQIFPVIDTSSFNILLSHSPFDFDVFEKWGADLVLAGHVHGGLIRLPFVGGILSPERTFFPKYDFGEYSIGDSKMILSRGLGNGTINLRVFNNPEICLIKFDI